MNVLYFTNIPSPYKIDFLNELSKMVNITCIFNNNSKDDQRNAKWYKNDFSFESITINSFGYKQLKKILSQKKYDIVINANYACINSVIFMYILKKNNIKFFISADGGFINENDSLLSSFLKNHFISKADYYFSTGVETDKYLMHYGANKNSIFHVPLTSLYEKDILNNPIIHDQKKVLKEKHNINYSKVFLSVGNFIYRKGYDLFLKAINNQNYNDVAFIIIGGGKEKDNYIKYLKTNKINNVFIIDYLSKEELKDYYKMADIFFFPSREDIWGLVINEAMAHGLPIISSKNVLAAKELVDNNYLYSPEDINELNILINRMNDLTKDELFHIGEQNLERIKSYTIENMAKQYFNVFERIAKNGK